MRFSVSTTRRQVPSRAALAFFVVAAMPLSLSAHQTVDVTLQNYRFEPAEVRIRPGDTVRWTNQEKRTSHSVLFSAEQGGESERLFPQDTWQRRFEGPGRYPYSCGPHPEMKGVVDVVAP